MAAEEDFDVEEFAEGVKKMIVAKARSGGCCCTTTNGFPTDPDIHELQQ